MVDSKLLKKYFLKQCDPEEERRVLFWLKANADKKFLHEMMKKDWQSENNEAFNADFDLHFKQILQKIGADKSTAKKRVRLPAGLIKIAASVALLIISVLTVVYFSPFDMGKTSDKLTQNFIYKNTGKGEKLTTVLEDGTKVMLNANTTLQIYDFDDSVRRVFIKGEAFFKVSHDKFKPFIVETKDLETTVLGTSFNVKNDTYDNKVLISLVSGSVSVKLKDSSRSLKLDPGQEIIYEDANNSLRKTNFAYNERISWKDGVLYFEEANIHLIQDRLESWYGVNIQLINSPEDDWKFTGTFKNENLENVLEGIRYMKDIDYAIRGNFVEIKFN